MKITNGTEIDVLDKFDKPIHIGDTLEFDEHEFGSPCTFVMRWEKGELVHPGVLSDLCQFCRIIHAWDAPPPVPTRTKPGIFIALKLVADVEEMVLRIPGAVRMTVENYLATLAEFKAGEIDVLVTSKSMAIGGFELPTDTLVLLDGDIVGPDHTQIAARVRRRRRMGQPVVRRWGRTPAEA